MPPKPLRVTAPSDVTAPARQATPAGNIAPGTSIGTAWPPLQGGVTYSETNIFAGYPQDWYVFYKTPNGTTATATITNTSVNSSCAVLNVYLEDQNGWSDAALNSATLNADQSVTFNIPANLASDPQGLYYIYASGAGNYCGPSGNATYTMQLGPSNQFANPARVPSKTGTAGTSIGDAWPPLQGGINYSHTNLFTGWPEDWYVVYKKPDSHTATVRIVNTTVYGTSCPNLNVYLEDQNGWSDGSIGSATLTSDGAVTFTIPANLTSDPQGLYYIYASGASNYCNSSGGASYTIELEPGSELANPARLPSKTATAGTSIGTAWPPLQGGINYSHTNLFAGWPEDWYVVYKKPDSRTATVRIVNTTVYGTSCPYINVYLQEQNSWSDSALNSATLNANGAVTFTIPANLTSDPQGLYYVWVSGASNYCGTSGNASYTIELEPSSELANPAPVPTLPATPARSASSVDWPPLRGGVKYAGANSFAGYPTDWYALYKKPDSATGTIRIVNTTVNGTSCPFLNVYLYDNHGTADYALDSATLNSNAAITFNVGGRLAGDPAGLYYLAVVGAGNYCDSSGSATYTIEPESSAEWGTAFAALPFGPTKATALGPLAGNSIYATSITSGTSQDWAYFVAKAALTVRLSNTSSTSAACNLAAAIYSSANAKVASATLGAGKAASLKVPKAGTYYVELSTGGCKPKAAVSALVEAAGSVTGPVLKVSDTTLRAGTHGKAYSVTIGVTGGKKPYAFTAVTALPAGLSLNKETGAITGKPAKRGSYTFTLTITDSTKPTHNILTVLIHVTIS